MPRNRILAANAVPAHTGSQPHCTHSRSHLEDALEFFQRAEIPPHEIAVWLLFDGLEAIASMTAGGAIDA